ncbi:MAG TPA: hypothetical protein VII45_05600, partial [Solirubrobacterales bacterium]
MRITGAMGFLSRKTKSKSVAIDEPHPIVEELKRMEEAVPERPEPDQGSEAPATGPVAEEDPSSSQAAGDVPSSTPPVEEA